MSSEEGNPPISLNLTARLKAVIALFLGGGMITYVLMTKQGFLALAPIWLLLLGICLAAYGFLQIILMAIVRSKMRLSDVELNTYGKDLEEATPMILDLLVKGRPAKVVADLLKESRGVPIPVTLKYIIALGKYAEHQSQESQ